MSFLNFTSHFDFIFLDVASMTLCCLLPTYSRNLFLYNFLCNVHQNCTSLNSFKVVLNVYHIGNLKLLVKSYVLWVVWGGGGVGSM